MSLNLKISIEKDHSFDEESFCCKVSNSFGIAEMFCYWILSRIFWKFWYFIQCETHHRQQVDCLIIPITKGLMSKTDLYLSHSLLHNKFVVKLFHTTFWCAERSRCVTSCAVSDMCCICFGVKPVQVGLTSSGFQAWGQYQYLPKFVPYIASTC